MAFLKSIPEDKTGVDENVVVGAETKEANEVLDLGAADAEAEPAVSKPSGLNIFKKGKAAKKIGRK